MRLNHLLLLIIAIAVVEIYLLIVIGGSIGALSTIALVFITAALGIWMLRQQGLSTLQRAFGSLQRGQQPLREVAEAPFLLLGGILLLLPGFFTDAIGFLCLFPLTRRLFLRFIGRKTEVVQPHISTSAERRPRIIEGEWKQDDH